MKELKYKPLAFKTVRNQKDSNNSCIEYVGPPESSYTVSDFCEKSESYQEKIRTDTGLKKVVINIVNTYKKIKSDYNYDNGRENYKKCLTFPDEGVRNNNLDNEECNLIVHVDDVINNYLVKDLLGQGVSGQVYLVYKNKEENQKYALKIIKNKKIYKNQSLIELKVVTTLNTKHNNSHIIKVYEYFFYQEHLCIVFELLNENLYQLLQHNHLQGISLNSINFIIKQILEAVEQIHKTGIIHCDIKPENILLKINKDKNKTDISVKVTDFGSACLKNNPMFTYIQSRFYRAPEVILGIPYTQAIDIWPIGLIAAELYLGGPLLPGYSEYDQLLKINKIIGKIPESLLKRKGKKISKFYNYDKEKNTFCLRPPKEGELLDESESTNNDFKIPFNINKLDDLITLKRGSRIKGFEINDSQSSTETISFIHFLKCMLSIIPEKRWTAAQLLKHPFIVKENFGSFLQNEPSNKNTNFQDLLNFSSFSINNNNNNYNFSRNQEKMMNMCNVPCSFSPILPNSRMRMSNYYNNNMNNNFYTNNNMINSFSYEPCSPNILRRPFNNSFNNTDKNINNNNTSRNNNDNINQNEYKFINMNNNFNIGNGEPFFNIHSTNNCNNINNVNKKNVTTDNNNYNINNNINNGDGIYHPNLNNINLNWMNNFPFALIDKVDLRGLNNKNNNLFNKNNNCYVSNSYNKNNYITNLVKNVKMTPNNNNLNDFNRFSSYTNCTNNSMSNPSLTRDINNFSTVKNSKQKSLFFSEIESANGNKIEEKNKEAAKE